MDLTTAFAHTLFPKTCRVLGVRMQPYCMGHALLLHRLGNALFCGDEEPQLGDLVQAIYVCSRDWERAAWGIKRPWARLWMYWHGCDPQVRGHRTGAGLRRGLDEFGAYVRYFTACVEMEQPDAPRGKPLPACDYMMLVYRLMTGLHLTEREALSLPFHRALWYQIVQGAEAGALSAVTEEQKAIIRELEAMEQGPSDLA